MHWTHHRSSDHWLNSFQALFLSLIVTSESNPVLLSRAPQSWRSWRHLWRGDDGCAWLKLSAHSLAYHRRSLKLCTCRIPNHRDEWQESSCSAATELPGDRAVFVCCWTELGARCSAPHTVMSETAYSHKQWKPQMWLQVCHHMYLEACVLPLLHLWFKQKCDTVSNKYTLKIPLCLNFFFV